MTRIISKNMLRDLKAGKVETFTIGNRSDLYKAAWDQGYRVGMESAQPKWISVEERLPEPEKDVLTLHRGKYHCIGYYSEDCELWILNDAPVYDETVTHWMPLPNSPKEG